jgi:hypothetical protein
MFAVSLTVPALFTIEMSAKFPYWKEMLAGKRV